MAGTTAKICIRCRQDCSGKPRTKDLQGNYTCKACLAHSQSAPAAAPAKAAAARGSSGGVKAPPVRAAAPVEDADVFTALLDSSPGTEPCESCGDPMPTGSIVCIRCGFNRGAGQHVKTRAVAATREKRARTGPVITGRTTIFAALGGMGLLLALSFVDPALAALFVGVALLYYVVSWILLLVDAFMDSALTGVLCLFLPFYAIYFLLVKCERPAIQLHCIISVLAFLVAAGVMAAVNPEGFGA
jgi:hypothetical protein